VLNDKALRTRVEARLASIRTQILAEAELLCYPFDWNLGLCQRCGRHTALRTVEVKGEVTGSLRLGAFCTWRIFAGREAMSASLLQREMAKRGRTMLGRTT
jgi:hypothetical protein